MKRLNRSKLTNYESNIRKWRKEGGTYREIADKLKRKFAIEISHNAIYSFLRIRDSTAQKYSLSIQWNYD